MNAEMMDDTAIQTEGVRMDSDELYFLNHEEDQGFQTITLWSRPRKNVPQENRHHSDSHIAADIDLGKPFECRMDRAGHPYDLENERGRLNTNDLDWFIDVDLDLVLDQLELEHETLKKLFPGGSSEPSTTNWSADVDRANKRSSALKNRG